MQTMRHKIFIIIFFLVVNHLVIAQESIFGTNDYIEYQVGNLPIILTASHGGQLTPEEIPDRTCNNPTTVTDAFTVEIAEEIKNSLYEKTGCYPHVIICHLKRTKIDCNRNIEDGACGNEEAEIAWNEFHNFINEAQNTANDQYNSNTFFIDIHGHGKPEQRIELGYLLFGSELENDDETLNSLEFVNFSSIQDLVATNINNFSHAELLRGDYALGTLLGDRNYPSVPSQQIPHPGGLPYFSGGYITANHTSYAEDNETNGVQLELNFQGIRDNASNRVAFAKEFSDVILSFLEKHTTVDFGGCEPSASTKNIAMTTIQIFPNPAEANNKIIVKGLENGEETYQLFDAQGRIMSGGEIINSEIILTSSTKGIYTLIISNALSGRIHRKKIVVY